MSDLQNARYTVEDRVAIITLDHPPVNAFDSQTMKDLDAALDEALGDENVKVIIITGAGQMAFVAGADINEINQIKDAGHAEELLRAGHNVFKKIETSRKPVIAAINGICLGGGLEMAMACHIRVAGDRARIGQPEINLGIIPGWGGTQRLPRIVGPSKAAEMILTGDSITAQEAYRLGLVNKVVPMGDVLKEAKGIARKIAGKSAVAIGCAMEAIERGRHLPLAEALDVEIEQWRTLVESEDMREGVGAFLEKRQPQFKDR
ncbi:MAG: enoyl-CoA hydratase-related protein [Anaerolineae bacterium]